MASLPGASLNGHGRESQRPGRREPELPGRREGQLTQRSEARRRTRNRLGGLCHLLSHLVAEAPPLVIASFQLEKGWLPTSDDAVIAWRSWNVFSGPPPLVGQYTQISASGNHAAFDLGPLQYYLLAVPEHLDPRGGVLVGSAVVVVLLCAVAIEAVRSVAGTTGGAIAGLGLALMTGTLVESSVNLAWNPSLGAYAFAATFLVAIAVSRGRFGWLPVGVATGCIAAQCHVCFILPVLGALAVAVVLGALERHRLPPSALLAAVALGVACFLPPLVQELSTRPGNWSVLLSDLAQFGPTVGIDRGLRGIAAATRLPPSWWIHVPPVTTVHSYRSFAKLLYRGSPAEGIAALALSAAIAVAARIARGRNLAALAGISAISGLAVAFSLGSVPRSESHYLLYYLYFALWPVGIGIAVSVLGAIAAIGQSLYRAAAKRSEREHARNRLAVPAAALVGLSALGVVAVAAAGGGLAWEDVSYGRSSLFLLGWPTVQMIQHVTSPAAETATEHGGRGAAFVVEAEGGYGLVDTDVDQSVAYALATRGLRARLIGPADVPLGPPERGSADEPVLELTAERHARFSVRWLPARSTMRRSG